jgi:hypothetical protein
MTVIAGMAGVAVFWRAGKFTVDMATGTSHTGVQTGQREGGFGMIERGRLPTRGGVTGGAICSKLTLMEIVSGMARITIRGRAFELKIGVTLGTGDGCVLAGQLEDGTVVIEAGGLPAAG